VSLSLANVMDENIHTVTSKIQQVASNCGCYPKPPNQTAEENLEMVVRANANNSVEEIKKLSPYLKSKLEHKEIGIVSAYHELSTGKVHFEEME
jgi:carbonic anhydrase